MDLTKLSQQVGERLLAKQWLLATAESCTGGWIAQTITDIAGSSQWFDRGFVTYSNEAKQDMLGVTADTLASYGAVSEPTATAMAKGALAHSRADIVVAVTGIAGPTGGTPDKPVGLVWHAWALRGQSPVTQAEQYLGNRFDVRQQTVKTALAGLLRLLA
ncbi:MAG: nicotinamide-nucleotide amidohydrolase family protein [Gammaproteobacteria bacterium]|jgi:nicotinamide-nucleotide amidase